MIMTDNMKCPFCGAELQHWGEDFLYCENLGCPMSPQIELPISIWQVLIDGKKAQRQLRTVKDHCVKKVKAKEREIENYLNGMFVRGQEIGTLREQLKQAHDALDVAVYALKEYEDRDSYDCDGNWCGCEHSTAHKALTKITALEQKD